MARQAWIAATLAFMVLVPFWLGLRSHSPFWLLLVSAAVIAPRRPIGINYRLLKQAQAEGKLRLAIVSVFIVPWVVIAAVLLAPYGAGCWLRLGNGG